MSNERIDMLAGTVATASPTVDRADSPGQHTGSAADYEREICAVFADVLGVPPVAPNESFYALGGHSLLVVKLVRRIRRNLDIDISPAEIFDEPTPAAIARLLTERTTGRQGPDVGPRPAVVPLSPGQKRLWYLNRLNEAKRAYNIPIVLLLTGDLDTAALRTSLRDVVDRHEALRTVFPDGDTPRQQVVSQQAVQFVVEEILTAPDQLAHALADDAEYAFDLGSEIPFRARLHSLGAEEYALSLVVHHIAADGASIELLCDDIAEAYTARSAGRSPSWRPLPLHYADYTLWHLRALGDEDDPDSVASKQLDYWRTALAGLPEEIALPVDRSRGPDGPGAEGFATATVDASTYRRVADLAAAEGLTMFMVALAAAAVTLHLNGAGTDIPLGSPVDGRVEEEFEPVVGFFVNTLVLRTVLTGDPNMKGVLRRLRATARAAYANQDLPFDRLVEEINPRRVPGRLPLYQASVAWTAAESELRPLPGLRVTRGSSTPASTAKLPLAFDFAEQRSAGSADAALSVEVVYDSALFDQSTADRLANSAAALLSIFVDHPSVRCSALSDLDPFREQVSADPSQSAACTELETEIARVWSDVLGLDHVDVHSNFFTLGGDSLESIRIAYRLSKLGIAVTPEDLLANQTVAKLAATVPPTPQLATSRDETASVRGNAASLTTADAATIAERFG